MSATSRTTGRVVLALTAALVAATLAPAAPSAAKPHSHSQHVKKSHHVKADRARKTKAGKVRTVALPTGFRPEGIAAGPRNAFYVGSVADGRIWVGHVKGDRGRELVAPAAGRSLRGLLLDKRSGWLWAVGSQGSEGLVLAVSARTGEVKASITVPDAGFLNDLTFSKGAVWVTDSQVDRLLKIKLGKHNRSVKGYSTLAITGDWPTPDGFRANGIRTLKHGTLLLNNSTAGGLYTVNPRTGAAKAVTITGSPAVTGGDGMVVRGNTVYVVRGSDAASVTELQLRPTRKGVTAKVLGTLTDSTLDVPSTAALIGGKLWAVNARFGVADPDSAAFWVTGLSLKHRHHHHHHHHHR